jgi:hypothetical protein
VETTRARRRQAERLRRCASCGRKIEARAGRREPLGLLEDGVALCRACAVEADRDYEMTVFDAA